MNSCFIETRLPSLNEYVNACRENRMKGAAIKADAEANIALYIRTLPKFDKPVRIHFHWIEPNARRDLDNVAFAKKFILDAMVKLKKLKDDGPKCVVGFTDTFSYNKRCGVGVTVQEVLEDDESVTFL